MISKIRYLRPSVTMTIYHFEIIVILLGKINIMILNTTKKLDLHRLRWVVWQNLQKSPILKKMLFKNIMFIVLDNDIINIPK